MARRKRMAKQVGAYDAKTRFGELLSEVEETGISITITRRGVPVAQLVPMTGASNRPPADLFRDFLDFQAAHPFDGVTAKQLIEEGRRR
ncbi:MAG: type II toxin-antitoxin system prevent-host-death family antitoxin [Planctomycetota bacterium]|nr:type II toxin-antitoxin system prevent-host-death family antitoxin [Planctomycetota bacterium]